MKLIKYQLIVGNQLIEKAIADSEANRTIAKKEAHDHSYRIEESDKKDMQLPAVYERLNLVELFIENIKAVFPNMLV